MTELLSAYDQSTQALVFRVYAQEIPETVRSLRSKISHLTAWDLFGAAMLKDFGKKHIRIVRKGMEKPYLLDDPLQMNLSHCDGLAVCAIGTVPVGIDCESPRTVRENLLPRLCTPEECAYILAQNDKNAAFTRIWTLKEAYGKWNGEGIRAGFQTIGFSLDTQLNMKEPDVPMLRFFQLLHEKYTVSVCIQYEDGLSVKKHEKWEMITNGNGVVLCHSDA